MLHTLLCIKLFFFTNFFFLFDNVFFDSVFAYVYLFSVKLYIFIFILFLFYCLLSTFKKNAFFDVMSLLFVHYFIVLSMVFVKIVQFRQFSFFPDVSFFTFICDTNFFLFQNFLFLSSVHSVLVVTLVYCVTVTLILLFNDIIFFFFKKNYEYDNFKNYIYILFVVVLFGSLWTFYNSYHYLFWNWDFIEIITLMFFFCIGFSLHNFFFFLNISFFFLSILFVQLFRNFFFVSSHHIKLENFEKRDPCLFWYSCPEGLFFIKNVEHWVLAPTLFFLALLSTLLGVAVNVFFFNKKIKYLYFFLYKSPILILLAISAIFYVLPNLLFLIIWIIALYALLLFNFFFTCFVYFTLLFIFFFYSIVWFVLFINFKLSFLFHFDIYIIFFLFFSFLRLSPFHGLSDYLILNDSVGYYSINCFNFFCSPFYYFVLFNYKIAIYKICKLKFYVHFSYCSIFNNPQSQFLYYASSLNFYKTCSIFFYFSTFTFFYIFLAMFVFVINRYSAFFNTIVIDYYKKTC